MNRDKTILLQENELKPNRYAAKAALFSLAGITLVEAVNELGLYHVAPTMMRAGFLAVLLCSCLVQVIGRSTPIAGDPAAKYAVLLLICLQTLAITVVMPQWSELLLAMPVMLAMQYHNTHVTNIAILGVLTIALLSAPISFLLGIPQVDFLLFQLRALGYEAIPVVQNVGAESFLGKIFLYISLPRCLLVCCIAPLAIYVTRLMTHNIDGRASAAYNSSMDSLTEILNRRSFEARQRHYRKSRPRQLTCIYADANGLHEINNEQGHAAGDALLKTCARQMKAAFGSMTYRIGGDEFLSFMETADSAAVRSRMDKLRLEMRRRGYSISLGTSRLTPGMTVDELVQQAEQAMFADKRNYYLTTGRERRMN